MACNCGKAKEEFKKAIQGVKIDIVPQSSPQQPTPPPQPILSRAEQIRLRGERIKRRAERIRLRQEREARINARITSQLAQKNT